MSSSTSALKASKSIVESYVSSSSENSNATTTFTDHTTSECETNSSFSKKNIFNYVLNLLKHPKFKWALIAILLCIVVFIYFRSQNKKHVKDKTDPVKEDTRFENIDIQKDKNGRPILVDKKEQEYMDKITQLEKKEKELLAKINQINTNNILNKQASSHQQEAHARAQAQQEAQARAQAQQQAQAQARAQAQAQAQAQLQAQQQAQQQAQAQAQAQQQAHSRAQVQQQAQQQARDNEEDTESSDEVFIENENVMNHNLTMDEMNAIDKQLEDMNHMEYESD